MKFIAIGELMLRLSPPNYEKLVTTHDFRVNYGGAEANVAVSLANLGVDSTFFTVLPNSDLESQLLIILSLMMCLVCTSLDLIYYDVGGRHEIYSNS